MTKFILHNVISIQAEQEADCYLVTADVTGYDGVRSICKYGLVPSDNLGYAAAIRDWMDENEHEIIPFTPPTVEEMRDLLPPITPRQFWIAAASIGVTKAEVLAKIGDIIDPLERARMYIEVTEATSYERSNPYIGDLAGIIGVPADQLDSLWEWAATV